MTEGVKDIYLEEEKDTQLLNNEESAVLSTGKIMCQAGKKKKSRCQDSKVEKLKRAAIDRILSSQKLYV